MEYFLKRGKNNPIFKEALRDFDFSKFDIITGVGISDKLLLTQNSKLTLYFTELNPAGFFTYAKNEKI